MEAAATGRTRAIAIAATTFRRKVGIASGGAVSRSLSNWPVASRLTKC